MIFWQKCDPFTVTFWKTQKFFQNVLPVYLTKCLWFGILLRYYTCRDIEVVVMHKAYMICASETAQSKEPKKRAMRATHGDYATVADHGADTWTSHKKAFSKISYAEISKWS